MKDNRKEKKDKLTTDQTKTRTNDGVFNDIRSDWTHFPFHHFS